MYVEKRRNPPPARFPPDLPTEPPKTRADSNGSPKRKPPRFYATNVMVFFPLLPRTSPSSHDQAFDCLGFSSGRFQFHAVP
jgi:hypothetical protein